MRHKDFAALIILAGLWGASFLFIRIAVAAFGPVPLMAGRVLLAAVLLWVALRLSGQRPTGLRSSARQLLVLGLVNAALPFTLVAISELYLNASLVAVLIATSPLFSVLLSARSHQERVDGRRAIGLGWGVLGVGALVGWSPIALTGITMLSIAATLLAAASYAFAGDYAARHLKSVPAPSLALGQQLGAAVWLVAPALLSPPSLPVPSAALWALLGLATLCTAAAYLLYFFLIGGIGPLRTNSVCYLIPLFGVLWGALFLGEPITPGMWLGLAIILGSVLLVNVERLPSVTRWSRRGLTVAHEVRAS